MRFAAGRSAWGKIFGIIHGMKPIATDNYDFERLITDGYVHVGKTDMLHPLQREEAQH